MPTRREWAEALGFSGADENLLRFESQAHSAPAPATRRGAATRRAACVVQLRLFHDAKDRG